MTGRSLAFFCWTCGFWSLEKRAECFQCGGKHCDRLWRRPPFVAFDSREIYEERTTRTLIHSDSSIKYIIQDSSPVRPSNQVPSMHAKIGCPTNQVTEA
ncbi:hypothetical protein BDV41DRAFT_557379 [Aspergillus transmontanensis]|uniref:RanBP2-type domain-containing protein n=1 Tax=Aspergillus transmontanensis TaxID=1034304 RepID=A0A5N6VDY8_9EURO|nr:hypothetical protein BDV41DRAFT_557379 [Aspergillus transmontanensis]